MIATVSLPLLVGGAYLAARGHVGATAATMGEITGLVLVPVSIGSIVAGFGWIHRRWLGVLLTSVVLGVVVCTVGLLFAWSARESGPFRALTDADRAPPVVEDVAGQPMLVQHALGLALPVAPTLTYVANDTAIAQTLAAQHEVAPHMVGWRYTDATGAQQLVVMIDLASLRSPEREAALFGGVVDGARNSLEPQGFTDVRSESRGPLDHVLRGHIAGTRRDLMMRIFAYTHGDAFVIATVTVGGEDAGSLEAIANGARSLDDGRI